MDAAEKLSRLVDNLEATIKRALKPKATRSIPLNEAARAEHQRHLAAVNEVWPRFLAVRAEMKAVEGLLAAENERWGSAMRHFQPEFEKVDEFRISDDGATALVPVEEEEQSPRQPDWAKMLAEMPADSIPKA